MSIENNLKRIADALEKIAESGVNLAASTAINTPAAQQPPVATPAQTTAPTAPPEQVQTPPVQPVTTPPPAAQQPPVATPAQDTEVLTDEQMNGELVKEFQRLGDRTGIDAVMTQQGVTGVAGLTGEQQQALLTAVRALQPAA